MGRGVTMSKLQELIFFYKMCHNIVSLSMPYMLWSYDEALLNLKEINGDCQYTVGGRTSPAHSGVEFKYFMSPNSKIVGIFPP